MGQKISPLSNRLMITKDWKSRWFASGKNYRDKLIEDIKMRDFIIKNYSMNYAIEKVIIKRSQKDIIIDIHSARPGLIIGRQGKGIEDFKNNIEKFLLKNKLPSQKIKLNVSEVKKPEIKATLIAQNIGQQVSRRIPYRRAIKGAISKAMESGARGVKIVISGRLNGAEISRSEKYSQGTIPISTLKNNIDFCVFHAQTTYGVIGIKVWVYDGKQIL
ncbi:MAG: 30S ribosomal protein S3 [Berkelbacteria bacterium GW2011_GWA2_35_9]|uniref:Small ribosomal subunit protein uS3 n=1 Tax=Berkelbacteria bacterium GW2011_GWA2_35_9 TaxID=1618333 RepID=A0A0G0GC11_9BACT|nr:MAG: 30S ribosomal protein S3 [Berkelbacteria bacterium GW2011_GWA2_35_9]